ncbi:SDR family oxidoreductase [uncultured Paraglaciecola sp.]|uniref:SDR family NAD(P)-dependent oxidoreductase n=1 Tax=uncultured Paraglaciecola sp. TaxID=1765024 RepID=UPI0030D894D7|tara:strand:+ start:7625 stop:8365 length:741 start_codon:yes stop_codon:yes gene_type:complete
MRQLNIVITGANSGIGLETTKKYLSLGHNVFAISRNVGVLNTLHGEYSDTLHVHQCDVTKLHELNAVYDEMSCLNTKIDILIANAGVALAEDLLTVTEESFDNSFNINVKGLFFTVQKSIPLLSITASIVLIGSIQSKRGNGSWAVYGATKAAVRSLTRAFAEELGKKGIRVNCVSPGVTETPILEKFGFEKNALQAIVKQVEATTPLGRLATPMEIANSIYFICSDEASFITGADLQVDGGLAQI